MAALKDLLALFAGIVGFGHRCSIARRFQLVLKEPTSRRVTTCSRRELPMDTFWHGCDWINRIRHACWHVCPSFFDDVSCNYGCRSTMAHGGVRSVPSRWWARRLASAASLQLRWYHSRTAENSSRSVFKPYLNNPKTLINPIKP